MLQVLGVESTNKKQFLVDERYRTGRLLLTLREGEIILKIYCGLSLLLCRLSGSGTGAIFRMR